MKKPKATRPKGAQHRNDRSHSEMKEPKATRPKGAQHRNDRSHSEKMEPKPKDFGWESHK